MMHEMMYEIVKGQYGLGCNIDKFLELGTITPDEYKEITGHDYGVEATQYYLPILDDLYISLDVKKGIHLINKGFASYQQKFSQSEIDELQKSPEIAGKVNLDKCQVVAE